MSLDNVDVDPSERIAQIVREHSVPVKCGGCEYRKQAQDRPAQLKLGGPQSERVVDQLQHAMTYADLMLLAAENERSDLPPSFARAVRNLRAHLMQAEAIAKESTVVRLRRKTP